MFYREAAGPPGAPTVVLLHGLGANADLNWHRAFAPLSRHFRVIAPDHRGHGRGIRSKAPFRLTDCADDVVALAGALGIAQFTAVGYSMGGPIAQLIWRRSPERLHGLVIGASSRDFRGHPRERLLFAGLGLVAGAVRIDALHLALGAFERITSPILGIHVHARWAADEARRSDVDAVMQAAGDLGRFTSRGWVSDIDVPTAVVVTTRDRLVPVRRQRKLAHSIRGAVTFDVECGHHGVADTEDAQFVHALVGACRAVSPWPDVEQPAELEAPAFARA